MIGAQQTEAAGVAGLQSAEAGGSQLVVGRRVTRRGVTRPGVTGGAPLPGLQPLHAQQQHRLDVGVLDAHRLGTEGEGG